MKQILLLMSFFFAFSCKEVKTKDDANSNIECELSSYDYVSVSNYHKKGCLNSELPLSIKNDLNLDGTEEQFLLTETYSKGGLYVLYQKIGNNWKMISDENNININHLGIEIDSTSIGEWKSFKSYESTDNFNWVWITDKYVVN